MLTLKKLKLCAALRPALSDNTDDETKASFSGEKRRNTRVFIFYLADDAETRYGRDLLMKLTDAANKQE